MWKPFFGLRFCFAICFVLAITADPAAAQQKRDLPSGTEETSLKQFLQTFDDDKTTRYIAAFRDLNGDGKPEAIVYLISNGWCGSGGCNTLVLAKDGGSWRVITNITISNRPIRVLPHISNGWHSIGVWVQGGGIQQGYEAELSFDGKTYPSNPSISPALRLAGTIEGDSAVSAAESGIPLYPSPANNTAPHPSFNCAGAKTVVEKLVCRDPDLASMDNAMANAYRKILQEIPTEQAAKVRREQLDWLKQYSSACNAVTAEIEQKKCVVHYLDARIKEIQGDKN